RDLARRRLKRTVLLIIVLGFTAKLRLGRLSPTCSAFTLLEGKCTHPHKICQNITSQNVHINIGPETTRFRDTRVESYGIISHLSGAAVHTKLKVVSKFVSPETILCRMHSCRPFT